MSCELFELEISALADGELEPERVLPAVDHLAGCVSCRRFFLDVRRLDLIAAPAGAGTRAPRGAWQRIAAASGLAAPAASRGPRPRWGAPRWAMAAAAALVGALAMWAALAIAGALRPAGLAPAALVARGGEMSERRFAELTAELVNAEARYRRVMLEVLHELEARSVHEDGSADVWFNGDDDQGGAAEGGDEDTRAARRPGGASAPAATRL